MPSIRVMPWADRAALVELGQCFYMRGSGIQSDLKKLQRGCELADAYVLRQAPPHAIGATLGLARAILAEELLASRKDANSVLPPATSTLADGWQDSSSEPHGVLADSEPQSDNALYSSAPLLAGALPSTVVAPTLAALYATAFAAFVTGYLDNKQASASKRTMYEVATEVNMPASFVALRHAIVHEGYTGLVELRRMGRSAMHWLWQNYWHDIIEDEVVLEAATTTETAEEEDATPDDLQPLAGLLVDIRQSLSTTANTAVELPTAEIVEILGYTPSRRRCNESVQMLFHDMGILELVTSGGGELQFFHRLDRFLFSLAQVLGVKFVRSLMQGLMSEATKPLTANHKGRTAIQLKNSKSDSIRPDLRLGALTWVRHLLNNTRWLPLVQKSVDLQNLAKPCLESPGPYATVTGVTLIRSHLWQIQYRRMRRLGQHDHKGSYSQTRRASSGSEAVRSLTEMIEAALRTSLKRKEIESDGDKQEVLQEDVEPLEGEDPMQDIQHGGTRVDNSQEDGKAEVSPLLWCPTPIGILPR